jgi:hypothetical protein
MATRADFVIAREGGVVIDWATGTAGTPGTYSTLGCPKGTWNFNRNVAEVDDNLDNWCIALEETAVASFSPGALSLDVSGTFEMILDDAAYLSMLAAIYASTYGFFRSTADNVGATETRVNEWGGYLTSLNDQFQGTGPSDVAVAFRANEDLDVS